MRKFVVSSALVVLVGAFSGHAFAGKVEVCEDIKFDPQYKGLYGLCNAYWNADENARDDILANFYKKAGPDGPGMPGLDEPPPEPVVCPCWPEGEIDIGVVHDSLGCQVTDTFAFASYDVGSVQYVTDTQYVTETTPGNYCGYFNQNSPDFVEYPDAFGVLPAPTDDEIAKCEEELLARIYEDFTEGCL